MNKGRGKQVIVMKRERVREGGKLSERERGRKIESEGEREENRGREGGTEGWGNKYKFKLVWGERKRLRTERGLILVNDLM